MWRTLLYKRYHYQNYWNYQKHFGNCWWQSESHCKWSQSSQWDSQCWCSYIHEQNSYKMTEGVKWLNQKNVVFFSRNSKFTMSHSKNDPLQAASTTVSMWSCNYFLLLLIGGDQYLTDFYPLSCICSLWGRHVTQVIWSQCQVSFK